MTEPAGPFVEHLLDDVAVERVPLLDAHVDQLERVLEVAHRACKLLLGGAARLLVSRRPRVGQAFDRQRCAVEPTLDVLELRIGYGRLSQGAFDPRERRGALPHGLAGRFQDLQLVADRPMASAPCWNAAIERGN